MSALKSRVIGTGSYLPEKILTNHDLEAMVETSDEWISTRTGIKERRVATGERSSEIAAMAAKRALKNSKLQPRDIDLVVTGTVTPDMVFPSTSCFIQKEIGLRPAIPAFDVQAACSGFLYALDIADRYIKTGAAKNVLVTGVDIFSRIVDWSDRNTCVLFGDGAGAVVLGATRGKGGILSSRLYSDGRSWQLLYSPSSTQKSPFEKKAARKDQPYLRMKGNEIFKLAVRSMNGAIEEALKEAGVTADDVSLLVPHQANIRIIKAMQERLNLPDERVFTNLASYGNTSAASIPIALDEASREKRLKRGSIIVLVAFGGGLTWASAVIRW